MTALLWWIAADPPWHIDAVGGRSHHQNVGTDTNVSVRDVVRLGRTPLRSTLSGWTAADEALVSDALEQVDIADRRAQPWQTLSGGERQRVHIARALAQAQQVLFLDEPTNHLDIHHQIEILRMVRELDLTSIVALHDMNLAAMFCDRILVLQAGAVVACGTPDVVLTETLLRDAFRVKAEVSTGPAPDQLLIRFKGRKGQTGLSDHRHSLPSRPCCGALSGGISQGCKCRAQRDVSAGRHTSLAEDVADRVRCGVSC